MKVRSLRAVTVIGIAILVLATFSVYRQVQQYRQEWLQDSAREVKALAQEIEHQLQDRRRKVETLRLIVAETLAQPVERHGIDDTLVQDDKGYYQARPPLHETEAKIGRLSGAGSLALADPQFHHELDAAWQLVPLFRLSHEQAPGIPWIYYLSAREFILLYPWAPLEQYRYDASIRELEFWSAVVPAANPTRALRWTSVYDDGAGKGLMITASAPVYVADAFRGIVAIDFLLTEFNALLAKADYEGATVALFDRTGQLAAHTRQLRAPLLSKRQTVLPVALDAAGSQWTPGTDYLPHGDWFVMQTEVADGAASLVALKPVADVSWLALKRATPFALLVVLGALLLALLLRSELAARQIEQLTITDGLTGAHNRRHFDAVFDIERERAQRGQHWFAVLMADIDQFKAYNDHYGHLAGDEALRRAAQAMSQATRRGGDLLFRWGGEEFAVLMSVESPAQARDIADRVRLAVQQLAIPHAYSPHGVLTVSIGIALTAKPAQSTRDALIRHADRALYEAKDAGRNALRVVELPAAEHAAA